MTAAATVKTQRQPGVAGRFHLSFVNVLLNKVQPHVPPEGIARIHALPWNTEVPTRAVRISHIARLLRDNGPLSAHDIADRLPYTSPNLDADLKAMAERGLVEKRPTKDLHSRFTWAFIGPLSLSFEDIQEE